MITDVYVMTTVENGIELVVAREDCKMVVMNDGKVGDFKKLARSIIAANPGRDFKILKFSNRLEITVAEIENEQRSHSA